MYQGPEKKYWLTTALMAVCGVICVASMVTGVMVVTRENWETAGTYAIIVATSALVIIAGETLKVMAATAFRQGLHVDEQRVHEAIKRLQKLREEARGRNLTRVEQGIVYHRVSVIDQVGRRRSWVGPDRQVWSWGICSYTMGMLAQHGSWLNKPARKLATDYAKDFRVLEQKALV